MSNEHEERLKQIRKRRMANTGPSFGYTHELCKDIDFLLALLDGQAAGDDCVKWDANHWMLNVFTNTEFTFAQKVEALVKYHSDAATRMRDKCVRLVEDSAPALNAAGDSATIGPIMLNLIEKMESLTLDQVEKEKPQS